MSFSRFIIRFRVFALGDSFGDKNPTTTATERRSCRANGRGTGRTLYGIDCDDFKNKKTIDTYKLQYFE